MRTEILQRNHIGGWGFSLLLHGLLLCALWPVVRHLPVPIQLEPFRWDVTFIERSQQSADVEPTSDASLAAASSAPAHEILQSVAAMRPDPAEPTQEILPLAHTPSHDLHEPVRSIDDVTPVMAAPTHTVVASAEPEPAPPTSFVPDMKPMPMIQEVLPVQRDATEQPQTGVAASRSDYSWLQRAVSRRLEELKRSSRPLIEEAGKLKVLVSAVISHTGELMEAEVVNSSGLARIDQEAVSLVQRAFPMTLDETLDRPQIVMRIPITYSLD